MARLTLSQKQQRLLVFLAGTLQPAVFAALRRRGFDEETHMRGLELIRRSLRARPSAAPASEKVDLSVLEDLQASWFPVVDATLEANFPEVHEKVLAGIGTGQGAAVVIAMRELHDRVAALRASDDAVDRSASALLEKRGFTQAVLESIDVALAAAVKPVAVVEPAPEDTSEEDLWRFYVEWSQIARAVVREKRGLRTLGFRRTRRVVRSAVEAEAAASPGLPLLGAGGAVPVAGPSGANGAPP